MLETYRDDLSNKYRRAERLATIGQFSATIGHELRNPLAVMESSLFLLRQQLGAQAMSERAPIGKHLSESTMRSRARKRRFHLLDFARNRPPQRTLRVSAPSWTGRRRRACFPGVYASAPLTSRPS